MNSEPKIPEGNEPATSDADLADGQDGVFRNRVLAAVDIRILKTKRQFAPRWSSFPKLFGAKDITQWKMPRRVIENRAEMPLSKLQVGDIVIFDTGSGSHYEFIIEKCGNHIAQVYFLDGKDEVKGKECLLKTDTIKIGERLAFDRPSGQEVCLSAHKSVIDFTTSRLKSFVVLKPH